MNIVRLPRLGQTMESGIITLWCLDEGDEFSEGQPLYEVETDKMQTEVEAKQTGRLARVVVAAGGDEVAVGTTLAVIADVGEDVDDKSIDEFLAGAGSAVSEELDSHGEVQAPPDESALPAAGDVGRVLAVPKARAVAKDRSVDLASVPRSRPDGVIRVVDVNASADPTSPEPAPAPAPAPAVDGDGPAVSERIVVRGIAKTMAETMSRSWSEIPQFTQQTSLDATALTARLKRLRHEGVAVSFTDLLVGAVSSTAIDVPEVNATFAGKEIIRYADVNVSIAVATDRGLLTPVIHRTQELSIGEIVSAAKTLASRARDGKLSAADMAGGTITVSNLGAFGIDTGTPIVNPPQSAIVFVGSMGDQAVVVDGRIVVQPRLNIAVAYDHRVVDGMTGARFLSALKATLEAGG